MGPGVHQHWRRGRGLAETSEPKKVRCPVGYAKGRRNQPCHHVSPRRTKDGLLDLATWKSLVILSTAQTVWGVIVNGRIGIGDGDFF